MAISQTGSHPRLAIDIGGNIGNYTAELRLREPGLEVHVFEPSLANVRKLTHRFGGDPMVHIVSSAVSDSAATATLYSNEEGSGLASLNKRKLDHFGIDFEKMESVSTLRFEDYWKTALKERAIDLVKLDIEGHEMVALRGFGEALRHTGVVQFEFGGCNIDSRTYFQDFWYFFEAAGFRLSRVTPWGLQRLSRYRESDEFFTATNFLAVNVAASRV